MTAFAKPTPLDRQLAITLCALREARKDGDAIRVASRRFCDNPELDARLRVSFKRS